MGVGVRGGLFSRSGGTRGAGGVGALLDARVHAGEDGRPRPSVAVSSEDQLQVLANGLFGLRAGLAPPEALKPSLPAAVEAAVESN